MLTTRLTFGKISPHILCGIDIVHICTFLFQNRLPWSWHLYTCLHLNHKNSQVRPILDCRSILVSDHLSTRCKGPLHCIFAHWLLWDTKKRPHLVTLVKRANLVALFPVRASAYLIDVTRAVRTNMFAIANTRSTITVSITIANLISFI